MRGKLRFPPADDHAIVREGARRIINPTGEMEIGFRGRALPQYQDRQHLPRAPVAKTERRHQGDLIRHALREGLIE
jgi:hypothetical protein